MITVAVILGFLLLNVVLAYVPIILIVGYNLRPKPKRSKPLDRYLRDEISTDEYVDEVEREWAGRTHAPLD